ncbi:electron transfer flavoprotein subunit beta [Pandoraea vervacti]|uniref:Electron transfer flavoprotein subunit beta n=1 Tax=Pandoraea vervacti TaxID=656178 RepID=A0ABM5SW88_9BURK|nr:FAD-binding protein [Pandoraea vervacti]AJP56771.1 electron transfer flavoprotein subunit beta [Pandoraea vervacti]
MTTLVIAEHDHQSVKPATLSAISAAQAIGAEIHVLIAGHETAAVAEQARRIVGVSKVLVADAQHLSDGLAENLQSTVLEIAHEYTHVLAAASAHGKNLMPRIAARLDVAQISDVTAVVAPDTFKRPIYAGNAIATVKSADPIKVLTIRATAFDVAHTGESVAELSTISAGTACAKVKLVGREIAQLTRPELASASIVVSGGRGLNSKENYENVLAPLADKLNAALGASRAAVDSGFAPNDYQVGQTGKVVAPDLYIAVGISGAIQHLAGMKESKVIVAINQDPEAPIFGVADYGLVGDLFSAVPEMVQGLGG